MAEQTSKRLSKEQFWKLRYLFIPISFVPRHQEAAHVAVCAVSPEARSVDYICSGADTGLPDSPRSDGAHCLPQLFSWLATLIGQDSETPFIPSEWTLRTGAGRLQNLWRGDCGIYTVTHAMTLAFGYGYGIPVGAFPTDHQHKIIKRRKRYVQDLMFGGFRLYKEGNKEGNCQYYPLIDKKPEAREEDDFKPLPQAVLAALPSWCRPIKDCYAKCPNKAALKMHCRRNRALYPGYNQPEVSGRGVCLEKFIGWVEEMDEQWKRRKERKERKDGVEKKKVEWVDPRCESRVVSPKHALWVK